MRYLTKSQIVPRRLSQMLRDATRCNAFGRSSQRARAIETVRRQTTQPTPTEQERTSRANFVTGDSFDRWHCRAPCVPCARSLAKEVCMHRARVLPVLSVAPVAALVLMIASIPIARAAD